MRSLPCNKVGSESAQRARFEALRERVFDEMARGSGRWRLQWVLPMHCIIVGLLILRGESAPRAIIQGACVGITAAFFVARLFSESRALSIASFFFWITTYFLLCATTGGLSSPLLVILGLMVCVVSMSMQRPTWLRPALFFMVIGGFLTLALVSHTAVGQLVGPLASTAEGPSVEHVLVALLAVTFTMVGIFRMGWTVTSGYERAALELAERREELCSENEIERAPSRASRRALRTR